MAGYSGTPLPQKLGIKSGHRLLLVDPPPAFTKTLGALPGEVTVSEGLRGKQLQDVIVAFFTRRADLEAKLPKLEARLEQNGGLWIAWPKKVAKTDTDITEDAVRRLALEGKLVDNKVCAIDDHWSGLRLVIRVKERKG